MGNKKSLYRLLVTRAVNSSGCNHDFAVSFDSFQCSFSFSVTRVLVVRYGLAPNCFLSFPYLLFLPRIMC
jgi:hypothetical protein